MALAEEMSTYYGGGAGGGFVLIQQLCSQVHQQQVIQVLGQFTAQRINSKCLIGGGGNGGLHLNQAGPNGRTKSIFLYTSAGGGGGNRDSGSASRRIRWAVDLRIRWFLDLLHQHLRHQHTRSIGGVLVERSNEDLD